MFGAPTTLNAQRNRSGLERLCPRVRGLALSALQSSAGAAELDKPAPRAQPWAARRSHTLYARGRRPWASGTDSLGVLGSFSHPTAETVSNSEPHTSQAAYSRAALGRSHLSVAQADTAPLASGLRACWCPISTSHWQRAKSGVYQPALGVSQHGFQCTSGEGRLRGIPHLTGCRSSAGDPGFLKLSGWNGHHPNPPNHAR